MHSSCVLFVYKPADVCRKTAVFVHTLGFVKNGLWVKTEFVRALDTAQSTAKKQFFNLYIALLYTLSTHTIKETNK